MSWLNSIAEAAVLFANERLLTNSNWEKSINMLMSKYITSVWWVLVPYNSLIYGLFQSLKSVYVLRIESLSPIKSKIVFSYLLLICCNMDKTTKVYLGFFCPIFGKNWEEILELWVVCVPSCLSGDQMFLFCLSFVFSFFLKGLLLLQKVRCAVLLWREKMHQKFSFFLWLGEQHFPYFPWII